MLYEMRKEVLEHEIETKMRPRRTTYNHPIAEKMLHESAIASPGGFRRQFLASRRPPGLKPEFASPGPFSPNWHYEMSNPACGDGPTDEDGQAHALWLWGPVAPIRFLKPQPLPRSASRGPAGRTEPRTQADSTEEVVSPSVDNLS